MKMIPDEKRILNLYRSLNDENQKSLFDFAQYLASKNPETNKSQLSKVDIEPEPGESVMAALKRLKKTYPMIESMSVLNRASELLTAHLIQGRDKQSVISDLEKLFEDTYENFKKDVEKEDQGIK